jgi:hypothetical protein
VRFLEIVVIAMIGVGLLLTASVLPSGDDTHRNIITSLGNAGTGFCAAALTMWTHQLRNTGTGRDRKDDHPPYASYEASPAAPGKEKP